MKVLDWRIISEAACSQGAGAPRAWLVLRAKKAWLGCACGAHARNAPSGGDSRGVPPHPRRRHLLRPGRGQVRQQERHDAQAAVSPRGRGGLEARAVFRASLPCAARGDAGGWRVCCRPRTLAVTRPGLRGGWLSTHAMNRTRPVCRVAYKVFEADMMYE